MDQKTIRIIAVVIVAAFLIVCAAAVGIKSALDGDQGQQAAPLEQQAQDEQASSENEELTDAVETDEGMEELSLSLAAAYLRDYDWKDFDADATLHFTQLRIDDIDASDPKHVDTIQYGYQIKDAYANSDRSDVRISIYRFPYEQVFCEPESDDVITLRITAASEKDYSDHASNFQMTIQKDSDASFRSKRYLSIVDGGADAGI